MSLPCPEELRRKKQAMPTARLLHWAQDAGFHIRHGNGSHIICRHAEFKDIQFNIIADSKKLSSTMNLSDALKELEKRRTAPASPVQDFEEAAQQRFAGLKENLPSYLTAEQDFKNGAIVVRDRQLPGIGATLKAGEERMLENKIRYIEDLKREAYRLFNKYDIVIGGPDPDGIQKFSHAVYKRLPVLAMPPYQANSDPQAFFDKALDFADAIEHRDIEHGVRLSELLSQDFVKATAVCYSNRRGERTNVVTYEGPAKKTLKFEFTSYSRGRVTRHNDIYEGRVSEQAMASLEARIHTIAQSRRAHEVAVLRSVFA